MSKYFKSVKSFDDLKSHYKKLLVKNHPDNGGDTATMQEINVEYDALFAIWKSKKEEQTGEKVNETAESTRRWYYTQNGWEGSRYDGNLSLKEIAKIVRTYVKEKYPTCKFSVRTSYASMCQKLHVEIKEFPEKMYKTGDDLRKDGLRETVIYNGHQYEQYTKETEEMLRDLANHGMFDSDSWTDEDLIQAYEKAIEKDAARYAILTEYFKSVIEDVNAFVQSYNYDDSDAMIDYFDTNFYYFNCKYSDCKVVPKTARIRKKPETTVPAETNQEQEYDIKPDKHTKTGADIWVVKIIRTLSREEYVNENKKMRSFGGYYSKFKHGFIFDYDPTEKLA